MKKSTTKKETAADVVTALTRVNKPKEKKVLDIEIKSVADREVVASLIKQVKENVKLAKEKESAILDPLSTAVKEVKSLFKPFYDSAMEVEGRGKVKLLEWDAAQEAKIKKLEDRVEKGTLSVASFMGKTAGMVVESKSSSTRTVKQIEVVDITKVPREFLVPDMAAIKLAFKEGKKVAGCVEKSVKSLAI